MQNPDATIISQYANSPTLRLLIETANEWIDPAADIDAFYSLVWNVDTAEGYGLDVWGRIVGVGRNLTIASPPPYFGFETGTDSFQPFNSAPFWNGSPVTQNYRLSDNAYRVLILTKAMANIARTDIPTLNALLGRLFAGRGRAYVNDLGAMQMRFTFEFYLEPYELAIMTQSGALPRPTGVDATMIQIPSGGTFGFAESGAGSPFGSGTFLSQGAIVHVG